ncbi:MAG TPA: diguanylate cyclase [Allosphingosinicella sp.]|nr:diguanylate cyclase [Allosphingosinicella sp.]
MDSGPLYHRIGAFLAEHGLWPSPDNYALAYALVADEASPAAVAVKAAISDGLRLTQREADRIKSEVGVEITSGPAAGIDSALLSNAAERVEQFAAIVESSRAAAQSYGADLQAGADRLEAGEEGLSALVAITRAMAQRTKTAEQQLTDARDEAQTLRAQLAEAGEEARSDPLTRLPNRRAFEERLAELESAGKQVAVAICDIDLFKRINDTYGHGVGDRVIRTVADTLSASCGGHMVARLGGEEFVVLFEETAPAEAALLIDAAREILGARHFKVRETDAPLGQVTFSAGIACGRPGQNEPGLQRADALLYKAKNAGRNQVCFEVA